jgi:DNA-binding CsgD family transcriptional regulator
MRRWELLRTVLIYGGLLGLGIAVLQWMEVQFIARTHSLEIYLFLLAVGFMAFGVWIGSRLFRKTPVSQPFEPNIKVQETLGISEREREVLELLASGKSNKEISASLSVSPNTVKTHVARLYEKLEVSRRTEAIVRARELGMLP